MKIVNLGYFERLGREMKAYFRGYTVSMDRSSNSVMVILKGILKLEARENEDLIYLLHWEYPEDVQRLIEWAEQHERNFYLVDENYKVLATSKPQSALFRKVVDLGFQLTRYSKENARLSHKNKPFLHQAFFLKITSQDWVFRTNYCELDEFANVELLPFGGRELHMNLIARKDIKRVAKSSDDIERILTTVLEKSRKITHFKNECADRLGKILTYSKSNDFMSTYCWFDEGLHIRFETNLLDDSDPIVMIIERPVKNYNRYRSFFPLRTKFVGYRFEEDLSLSLVIQVLMKLFKQKRYEDRLCGSNG